MLTVNGSRGLLYPFYANVCMNSKGSHPEKENALNYPKEIPVLFNLCSLDPQIFDPKIPMRDCLELDKIVDPILKKMPLKQKQRAKSGLSGKVKIVRFRKDPKVERWFAIKRPGCITKFFANRNSYDFSANLKQYKNNVRIASRIGKHPNFMGVHGIVVKEKKNGNSKPYLVLEYIEGANLRDLNGLTYERKMCILSQLKDALLHLYDVKILPRDLNFGNYIITAKDELKIIDYDAWIEDDSPDLGNRLYEIAGPVVRKFAEHQPNDLFHKSPSHLVSRKDLEDALNELFKLI